MPTSPPCPGWRSTRSTGRPTRRPTSGWSGSAGRGSSRSPAASIPAATAAGRGRSGSSPASATPEQTNERYQMILAAGGGGLSVAFDMPTLMGRDSDDPRSLGEVGHCGVAIDSAADLEVLFAGIDLGAGHHLDDDLRPGGADLLPVRGRGRAAGRRPVDAQRHPADRHLQGVHRAEGVAVPPGAAPAADRRPDGVLHRPDARVQAAQRVRLPHPRGGIDRRPGTRLHPGRRVRLRRARPVPGAGRRPVRARAELLLRRPHRLLRGDRQVPGRPPDLGALAARPLRRHRRPGRSGCGSTPRPPGSR